MAIRQGLLALLDEGPAYGYALKTLFEERTGGTWPLNIGQVYTTLGRLERDGLVESAGQTEAGHPLYALTAAGREEVSAWFSAPVPRERAERDELAIKLALAITAPGVDVRALVQVQRSESMRVLQELTRLKANADSEGDAAWLLVVDRLIFDAEAELRWLDHCESRVVRLAAARKKHRSAAAGTRVSTR